jgi:hypothetical protein
MNNKKSLIERILEQKLQGRRTAIATPGRPTAGDDDCSGCETWPDDCGDGPKPHCISCSITEPTCSLSECSSSCGCK